MPADAPAGSRTVPAVLRRNRDERASKPVLITDERSISHGDLDAMSSELAARLVSAGVGKGARVALMAPNGVEWATTAMAVLRVGGVLVPLSTLLRPPELTAQLQVARATHFVLAREFRGRSYFDELEGELPGLLAAVDAGERHAALPFLRMVRAIDDVPRSTVSDDLVTALEQRVRPSDDLAILFTSGSRGAPKGTIHTHGGALHAVESSLDARCFGMDDRIYIPMPWFWTGGFCSGLLSTLVVGGTLVAESVPEPTRTLQLLQRERVTLFRGWPDQAAALAAHPAFASADLSSLGAGSLPAVLPASERPAPGARPNLFGMTETCGPYAGGRADVDLPDTARGSCGKPFDGIEVRITDVDTGHPRQPGEVGEMRVRGRNVMRGICGRTRDVTFDHDGFYPTGDLGSLDESGYLWFRGRADDMFKVKGATVYPSEVEAALRSVRGVQQAHVTNLATGDGSDEVAALVVASIDVDELVRGVRARLSSFKVPTQWVVTPSADAVPMLASSKVDKAALQELLRREGRRADSTSAARAGSQPQEGTGA